MKKIFFAVLAVSTLRLPPAYAVMPPSTSLEEPVGTAVSGWNNSGGRYQVLAGKVAMPPSVRGEQTQEIETILKLDRETGKSWVLEVTPGDRHYVKRWIEIN